MLCDTSATLCGAGRGDGVRTTEGRDFTGRRSDGGATGLTRIAFFLGVAFFLATGLRAGAFLPFAALREEGVLPLPPFLDLPFAMRSFPLPVESDTFT